MAKTDNLSDFLTDVANSIRTKTGTTEQINAQDFSAKILNIQTGGENTLKNLLDATKYTTYLFNDYNGTSVDGLIQPNDTENVTTMYFMFNKCTNLTTIPQLNTSNVTDMHRMFYKCTNLTTIPQLNTSNVTNMNSMFMDCTSLTTIPLLNTSNVTDIGYMFYNCASLTTIPQLNTSKATSMSNMFNGCTNLTTVPALDASNVTGADSMKGMFANCTNLKSILMTNIGVDLDISASTKFEREDLLVIINNLKQNYNPSDKILTMRNTSLAKLTDEDKAIASDKGWNLLGIYS